MVSRYRVAVIESDADVRELVAAILDAAGFEVLAVPSAELLARSWRGDVIVTDTFETPYRTSAAVAYVGSLRARWHTPIVVVSGHREATRDQTLLGADFVVDKPFEMDELTDTVVRAAHLQRASPD